VGGSAAGGGGAPRPFRPAAAPSSEPPPGNRLRAKSRGEGRTRNSRPRRRAVSSPSLRVRYGRRRRAKALTPRCSADNSTASGRNAQRPDRPAAVQSWEPRAGNPLRAKERGRRPRAPQLPPPPSDGHPSRAVSCGRRQRASACPPRCRVEQGARIGTPAACQEQGHGLGAPQSPPPPSVNRPRGAVRCERPQRARACPPRCSAELGTPIGEPAACKRARATAARTAVTPAAERRPPESGGQLRAASARKGLPASLQCRAGNPKRGSRCVQRAWAAAGPDVCGNEHGGPRGHPAAVTGVQAGRCVWGRKRARGKRTASARWALRRCRARSPHRVPQTSRCRGQRGCGRGVRRTPPQPAATTAVVGRRI